MSKDEAGFRCCSESRISGVEARLWRDSYAQALFARMMTRSALPSIFSAAVFSGAALSVLSVEIEDEDGTVFTADLDRLAGVGALVEQVAAWLRIVVGNPFPDGLPRGLDGLGEISNVEFQMSKLEMSGRSRTR